VDANAPLSRFLCIGMLFEWCDSGTICTSSTTGSCQRVSLCCWRKLVLRRCCATAGRINTDGVVVCMWRREGGGGGEKPRREMRRGIKWTSVRLRRRAAHKEEHLFAAPLARCLQAPKGTSRPPPAYIHQPTRHAQLQALPVTVPSSFVGGAFCLFSRAICMYGNRKPLARANLNRPK
jgi:hypothetical protein